MAALAKGGKIKYSNKIEITVGCGNEVYKPIDYSVAPHNNNSHIFDRKLEGNTTTRIVETIVKFQTDTPQCPHYKYTLKMADDSDLPEYVRLLGDVITNSTQNKSGKNG